MKAKKKRAMTKPMSELQKNTLRQGKVLYYFNGLITRMQYPDHDVRAFMSRDQIAVLNYATQVLHKIRTEVIKDLQKTRANILEGEIRSGTRCSKCNASGSKIKHVEQGFGPYALCKKCGNSWQVPNK